MAITGAAATSIASLYIGFYDRAPDPVGLNYWLGRLAGGVSLTDIAESFAASPEAPATYPYITTPNLFSPEQMINRVYDNIFGRPADTDGLAYYSARLEAGESVGSVLASIVGNAATNEDGEFPDSGILANKVAVGLHWAETAALSKASIYEADGATLTDAASESAADLIDGVTNDPATVDAANAETDAYFAPPKPRPTPQPEDDFSGDDTYHVDGPGVVINEKPGDGYDTVIASISYALPTNVERLILTGVADLDGDGNDEDNEIVGNGGNNVLRGFGGNDTLFGNAGDDTLDGGTGADRMEGGAGDDIYYVDDVGDVVVELPGEGTDTVYASIDYTPPYHVESLILTGSADLNGTGNGEDNSITGNTGNNSLYGGAGDDVLNGGAGNDVLDGGTGADAMRGGSGDDTYYVDDAGDTVIELLGDGTDTVYVTLGTYSVPDDVEIVLFNGTGNFIGYANDMGSEIRGGAWDNTLYGGDGDDRLVGGNGDDTLYGGAGDDELYGSNGINRLIGGPGADFLSLGGTKNTLVYSKNDIIEGGAGDRITGYISGLDSFEIEVPGLSTGPLTSLVDDRDSNAFQGYASGVASPQLILSHWNGTAWDSNSYLWVDFDGSDAEAGYLIANLGTASFVTAGDIWII